MAKRRLPMRQLRQILKLKYHTGLTHREIAKACSIGAGTVSTYIARAREAGLTWPLPPELDDATLEKRLFKLAQVAGTARPLPEWATIHRELKRVGVTLHLLWLEYREIHPEGYAYSQFCDRYRRWRRKLSPSMRQRHRPGEKVFLDFSGKHPHLVDCNTGELIPVELFVGVLGASSYTYAEATRTQQLPDWCTANTRMLEFFGGAPAVYVPDNLKSAIDIPCRYEPEVNRTFDDFAAHYGGVVIPARSAKPKETRPKWNPRSWWHNAGSSRVFETVTSSASPNSTRQSARCCLSSTTGPCDTSDSLAGNSSNKSTNPPSNPYPSSATSSLTGKPFESTSITTSRSSTTSTPFPISSSTSPSKPDIPPLPEGMPVASWPDKAPHPSVHVWSRRGQYESGNSYAMPTRQSRSSPVCCSARSR